MTMRTSFNFISQFYKRRNHEILRMSPDFQRMDRFLVGNQYACKAHLRVSWRALSQKGTWSRGREFVDSLDRGLSFLIRKKGRECIQKHGFETDLTRFHFWKTKGKSKIMVVNTWLVLNVYLMLWDSNCKHKFYVWRDSRKCFWYLKITWELS